jgi:hypothetical protein
MQKPKNHVLNDKIMCGKNLNVNKTKNIVVFEQTVKIVFETQLWQPNEKTIFVFLCRPRMK